MSKTSNALMVLKILSYGRIHSGNELANKVEVEKRMIRTYIQDLELAGYYISSIRERYGGYKLITKI